MEEQAKRNAPHIAKVDEFKKRIEAIKKSVVKDVKWPGTKVIIDGAERDIKVSYNNREMAIVATKLQEASFWADEQDIDQVKVKLTEARHWCDAYIVVLS